MAVPTPPSPPPAPNRLTDTDTQFVTKADAMMDWFADDMANEFSDFSTDLIAAAAAANYSTVSTSSVAIGTGSKSFTVETSKMFVAGQYVTAADAAAPTTNYMLCQVTSYNSSTGALVLTSLRAWGSGTKTSWVIGLAGPQGEGSDTLPSFTGNAGKVLTVNSGATATEWASATQWVQIGTTSPSAASSATISSIGTGYVNLLLKFSLTPSAAATMSLGVSGDGSSFGGSLNITSSTAALWRGTILIPSYNSDDGIMLCNANTGASSPTITSGTNSNSFWIVTGGIDALRITPASGTITGTITLYGSR